MKLELDFRKTPQQNAAEYYDRAKKARGKLARLRLEITKTRAMLEKEKQKPAVSTTLEKKVVREKEWFEKFHWSTTSGLLIIGGKDAKSNEMVVKKHLEPQDLFFHADVTGASATVLKEGTKATIENKKAAACIAAAYSRAWQAGRSTIDVYAVPSAQVKLSAKSGEYLAKGAFVIEGKREWFRNTELALALTVENGKIAAYSEFSGKSILIKPDARGNKGDSAKLVLSKLKQLFPDANISIDDVLAALPNGGSRII